MDTLIVILIVAMAANFTSELAANLLSWTPLDTRLISTWLTVPLVLVYHYLLSTEYPMLVVGSAASAFLSLAFGIIIERLSNTYTEFRRSRR